MILYHYTSVAMAESILHSGLKPSTLTRSDESIMRGVLWLTTDPTHLGHGLLTGKERPTESDKRYLKRILGRAMKNEVMADKTAVRIAVELDDGDPLLHSFVAWSKVNERPMYAKIMGLSALYEINSLSDAELKRAYKNAPTKEATWWLYFDTVSPMRIVSVAALVDSAFVPYSFESHGRIAFREYGFSVVSQGSLVSLGSLLPSTHEFDIAKAFCICANSSARPTVAVRGGGYQFELDLETTSVLRGDPPVNLEAIIEWVNGCRAELAECWSDAEEIFYSFYPHQRRNEKGLLNAEAPSNPS